MSAFTAPWSADNKDAPMTIRKNLKDNEEKAKKQLDRISKAVGRTFTLHFQGMAPKQYDEKISSSYRNREGEILASYLEKLADCFEKSCKDDMSKEGIHEALEKNTIVIDMVEKKNETWKTSYFKLQFKGGLFTLSIPADNFWTNIDQIAQTNLDKIIDEKDPPTKEELEKKAQQEKEAQNAKDKEMMKGAVFPAPFSPESKELSMNLRKNFKDNIEKTKAVMDRINKAVGKTFTVEMKGVGPKEFEAKISSSYQNRMGEIFYSYLECLAKMFERECKDDMIKEGVQEGTTKNVIVFELLEKIDSGYFGLKFADGKFILTIGANNYWTNIDQISNTKLEKYL